MFFKWAIRSALKKNAPKRIPLTGERAQKNDFYEIFVELPNLNWKVLVDEEQKEGLNVFVFEDEENGRQAWLPYRLFKEEDKSLSITHWYKGNEFKYTTSLGFLIGKTFRYHWFWNLYNNIFQNIYNKRTLHRTSRMELLNKMVEESIRQPNKAFSPTAWGVKEYSFRWVQHPEREQYQAHLRLIMDSLVDSRELIRNGATYQITAKALSCLDKFENEEQKHRDSMRLARITHLLTFWIIVIGLGNILLQLARLFFIDTPK